MSALFPQNHWNQPKYHDPWAKAHEWRYEHPVVAQKYIWRKAFPGLGIGIAAFVVYCVAEGVYNSAAGGSHGHGHAHKEGHGHGHNTVPQFLIKSKEIQMKFIAIAAVLVAAANTASFAGPINTQVVQEGTYDGYNYKVDSKVVANGDANYNGKGGAVNGAGVTDTTVNVNGYVVNVAGAANGAGAANEKGVAGKGAVSGQATGPNGLSVGGAANGAAGCAVGDAKCIAEGAINGRASYNGNSVAGAASGKIACAYNDLSCQGSGAWNGCIVKDGKTTCQAGVNGENGSGSTSGSTTTTDTTTSTSTSDASSFVATGVFGVLAGLLSLAL